MRQAFAILVTLTGTLTCGCASPPPSSSTSAAQSSQSGENARSNAAAIRDRLTNINNGLEVRRWTIANDSQRLIEALASHSSGAAVDAAVQSRLRRNGFRLIRVAANDLDALLSALGGASVNASEWHGQVLEWRPLQERPAHAAGQGRAVAIDGRIERYDRGEFRLMMRSWTTLMEDGPVIHLELVPQHRRPEQYDLRRLLKPEHRSIEGYTTMALEMQLEAGFAYVLAGEAPSSDWGKLEQRSASATSATDARSETSRSMRVGPADLIGPEAVSPPTMGELLMAGAAPPTSPTPPTRQVLVFVPKVPAELFPLDSPALTANKHQGGR